MIQVQIKNRKQGTSLSERVVDYTYTQENSLPKLNNDVKLWILRKYNEFYKDINAAITFEPPFLSS